MQQKDREEPLYHHTLAGWPSEGLLERQGRPGHTALGSPPSAFRTDSPCPVVGPQARKALTERQRDLEMKTQQLEIKLSNKTEEDIKKARRKSTQAGESQAATGLLTQAPRRELEMETESVTWEGAWRRALLPLSPTSVPSLHRSVPCPGS